MKIALVAVVLALGLFNVADAYYYGLYGGLYGGLYRGFGYGYGWGYPYYGGFWGKRANEPSTIDRTECIYNKETSMLMCHGKTDKQECEAEMKLPKEFSYDLYCIGIMETTPDKHFNLIPRKMDNTGWVKAETTNTEHKSISMHQSDKFEDYGLKVEDKECFGKIVKVLGMSKRHEKVFFESEMNEEPESFEVIAGLSLLEKMPVEGKADGKSKRWYGMYGMGMWGMGYPWIYGKRDTSESIPVNNHELVDFKKEVVANFEEHEDSKHHIVREIQKLKRDVKMMKMEMMHK